MKVDFQGERIRVVQALVRADDEEWTRYSKQLSDHHESLGHNKSDFGDRPHYSLVPDSHTAGYIAGKIGVGNKVHAVFTRTAIDENGERVLWIASSNCGSARINWNRSPINFLNGVELDQVDCEKCIKMLKEKV